MWDFSRMVEACRLWKPGSGEGIAKTRKPQHTGFRIQVTGPEMLVDSTKVPVKDRTRRGKRSFCLIATRVAGFVELVALPSAPRGTSDRIGGGHVGGDSGRTKPLCARRKASLGFGESLVKARCGARVGDLVGKGKGKGKGVKARGAVVKKSGLRLCRQYFLFHPGPIAIPSACTPHNIPEPAVFPHGTIPHHSLLFTAAVNREAQHYHWLRLLGSSCTIGHVLLTLVVRGSIRLPCTPVRAGLDYYRWRAWLRDSRGMSMTGYLGQTATGLENNLDEMKDGLVCSSSSTLEPHAW